MRKNILIISYYFAPNNNIGSIRPTKIAKYLVGCGFNVTVICRGFSNHDSLDIPNGVKLFMKNKKPILKKDNIQSKKKRNVFLTSLVPEALKINYREKNVQNEYKDFAEYAFNVFNSESLKGNYFDAVLTSYGPICNLVVGLKIKKAANIYWISDYRDPVITRLTPSFYRKKYFQIQEESIRLADAITTVSDGVKKKLGSKNGKYEKMHVVYNGYDCDDLKITPKPLTDNKLHFLYAGSLYNGKRKVSCFFKAISNLAENKRINLDDIVIDYAGSEFGVFYSQAKKHNVHSIVVNHGFLDREECLELELNSDFLIVSTWNYSNEEGVIPGKLFECILAGKPIVAIVDGNRKNSEIKMIINNGSLGCVYESANNKEDFKNLCEYIYSSYSKWKNNEVFYSPNADYLKRFNYTNIIKEFISLIS